jgi:hypothetical protein
MLLFITSNGFSQDWEYLQADTVYKANRVKTCTVRFYGYQWGRFVFSFDTNGRVIEEAQFNSTGEKFYNQNIYRYNEKGKLAVITYFNYWHRENKRIVEDSLPHLALDWSTRTFHYDLNDRLIRSLFNDSTGNVVNENTYTYNPFTVHSEIFSPIDSSIVRNTTFYDAFNQIKKGNSRKEKAGEVMYDWDEFYENSYDERGRILKRKNTIPFYPKYGLEYVYGYDSKGLLMVLNSRRIDEIGDCGHQYLIYEYTYWDENCSPGTVKR